MSTCDGTGAILTGDMTRKLLGDRIFGIDQDALSRYIASERITLFPGSSDRGGSKSFMKEGV